VESIEMLKGRVDNGCYRLSMELAARMIRMACAEPDMGSARKRAEAAIRSGAALRKFREIVSEQGGDPRVCDDYALLLHGSEACEVLAPRDGFLKRIDAMKAARAAMILGAGRDRLGAEIDPLAGLVFRAQSGERVRKGDPICTIYAGARAAEGAAGRARELVLEACEITPARVRVQPVIREVL
jgi:thymidine phosphorylase